MTATLRLVEMPTAGAVVLQAEAIAQGMSVPASETGGVLVVPTGDQTVSVAYSGVEGATLRSPDGSVQVEVPAGASDSALTLKYSATPGALDPVPSRIVGFKEGFPAFYLSATNEQGEQVHQFSKPLTLTVQYTPQQLQALGFTEEDLSLYWFEESQEGSGRWTPLLTTVDPQARTLTARIDHLSTFGAGEDFRPSSTYIPSLKDWQVGLFRGNVTYELEIEVPGGPSGIKPHLELAYNSAASDGAGGMRPKRQYGWAGKDWSFDTGYIALDKLTFGPATDPGHYSLVLNGQSFDLMRAEPLTTTPGLLDPSDYAWRTTSETFNRIRAVPNGFSTPERGGYKNNQPQRRIMWQLWTKDGTRYDFEQDAWWGWAECDGVVEYADIEPYKWHLSKVTDTHGNTISYSYDRKSQKIQPGEVCLGVWGTVDSSVWPTGVTWGGNPVNGAPDRYKVQFTSVDRQIDLESEEFSGQLGQGVKETRQLEEISVFSNSSNPFAPAAWELVRRYDLVFQGGDDWHNYLLSDASNCNGDNTQCQPNSTTRKLTLKEIRLFGSDNTTYLPPISFTYWLTRGTDLYPHGAWNRLWRVDNNQGGVETFEYQNIGSTLRSEPYAKHYKNTRRVTSRTVQDGQGNSYTWRYDYRDPANNSMGTILTNSDSGPNKYPNSATVYYNEKQSPGSASNKALLVHKPNTEFRGHAYVVETDPNGDQTEHWFYQGNLGIQADQGCYPKTAGGAPLEGEAILADTTCFTPMRDREFLKGREWRTVRHEGTIGAGTKLQEIEREFGVKFYEYGDSLSERLTGLWRAFSFESRTHEKAWEGGTTPLTRTTQSTYDIEEPGGYGNLVSAREFDEAGVLLRETIQAYKVLSDTTNYIVDRPREQNIKDGQGRWLARTVYGYDGSLGGDEPLTRGDQTLARKYYNLSVPPSTALPERLHSVDTSFGYDPYGNQTTVTTYNEYGETRTINGNTQWGPPGGGSTGRTRTTEYDQAFHVFPMRIIEPITSLVQTRDYDFRMGLMTRITGYNGESTEYTYDIFGRNKAEIKPGDSAGFPTTFIEYHDWERPVRYVIGEREVGGTNAYRPSMSFYDGLGREIQTKLESENCRQAIVQDKVYDGLGQVIQQAQPHYVDIGAENCDATSPFWSYVSHGGQLYRPTINQYDALQRTVRVQEPDPAIVTAMQYGIIGGRQVVTTTDANLHITRSESDVFGRLRSVKEYSGTGTLQDPYLLYATTSSSYTPLDLLEAETDAKNKTIKASYDSLGRKVRIEDPTMGTWTYQYHPSGNIKAQRDNRGWRIFFTFDALDRLTVKDYPDRNGERATFRYDEAVPFGKGKQTSMSTASASTRWAYDARGRVVQADHTVAELPGTRTFKWSYDSADRIVTRTYPSVAISPQQVVTERVKYEFDAAWRERQVCTEEGLYASICYGSNAQYTALDQPTRRVLGNGLVQSYHYTAPMQRLERIRVGTASSPGAIFDRAYAYQPVGNIESITKYRSDGTVQETERFKYDHLDRLVAWNIPDGKHFVDERYYYDVVGNLDLKEKWRSQTDNETYDYIYNYASGSGRGGPYAVRDVQVLRGNSRQSNPYSYDANGNTTTSSGPGQRRTFTWNADNLPVRIDKQGGGAGVTELYAYDAKGERVKTTRVNRKTFYLEGVWEEERQNGSNGATRVRIMYTLAGQVVAQRQVHPLATKSAGNSNLSGEHLYVGKPTGNVAGDAIDLTSQPAAGAGNTASALPWSPFAAYQPYQSSTTVAPDPNRDVTYLHSDHLGSISVATDYKGAQGQPQRQEFDPWGLVRNPPGPPINSTSLNFTGQRLDETGLLYYHARYYDPGLSRFVSPDSIVPGVGDAKGGNAASVGAIQNHKLTVDFHEPGFVTALQQEHNSLLRKGFWFQLDGEDRKDQKDPWGPVNPQALNRYAYTFNNPVRYTDPTGHLAPLVAFAVVAAVGIGSSVALDVARDAILEEDFDLGTSVRRSLSNPWTYVAALPALGVLAKGARILPYVQAAKLTKGKGGAFEAHHILEARHLRNWKGYTAEDIANAPAVVLSKAEHLKITNRIRLSSMLPYGKAYDKAEVWKKYQEIYKHQPEWLRAIKPYFR